MPGQDERAVFIGADHVLCFSAMYPGRTTGDEGTGFKPCADPASAP